MRLLRNSSGLLEQTFRLCLIGFDERHGLWSFAVIERDNSLIRDRIWSNSEKRLIINMRREDIATKNGDGNIETNKKTQSPQISNNSRIDCLPLHFCRIMFVAFMKGYTWAS
jgi:hypothetical protein